MMKPGLVLLSGLLSFAAVSGGRAQHSFRPEWAVGASGGVTFSSVGFSPKVQEDMLRGYLGGLTLRWITEKSLGLQVELNFKQQGWKENFDELDVPEDANYRFQRRMNYVELPFMTHIYFGGDRIRFFVNLGPQAGFLLGERTEENLNGATPQNINSQHTMPADKRFEWGIGGGPGLELRTPVGYFLLEGRYYYALSDFYNTRHQDVFSKASSQVISARLTWLVPFR
ncbi:MAG: PorT family protein [Tannerella sp.]|jgi:hypothetical protein|nr:PorT family protein [Tannerella sp.]